MVDKIELLAILEDERRRHPQMEACDLQKLLVQAALGGDHMLTDRGRMADGLADEWANLPAIPPDSAWPAIQPIDPGGRTARLHLAPCLARGVVLEDLVEMLWSQPRKHGTRARFDRLWAEALQLARLGRAGLDPRSLEAFDTPESLPHHSPGYGPVAYRVINDVSDPRIRARLVDWRLV